MIKITNWKTTATGAAGVLSALAAIIAQLSSGSPDATVLIASISGLITGVGLMFAKDANVTGGTIKQ